MNAYGILSIIVAVLYFQAAVVAMLLDHRGASNRSFALLAFALGLYAGASGFYMSAPDLEQAGFWYQVATPGMRQYPLLTVVFFTALTRHVDSRFLAFFRRKTVIALMAVPSLGLMAKTFLDPGFSEGFQRVAGSWINHSFPGSFWSKVYLAYLLLYLVLSLVILRIWARKTENQLEREQARVMFTASLVMLFTAIFVDAVLPRFFAPDQVPRLVSTVPVIWLMGIQYAVVKHRLLLFKPNVSHQLLDSLQQPLLISDWEFNILSTNSWFAKAFNLEGDVWLGQKFWKLFSDAGHPPEEWLLLVRGQLERASGEISMGGQKRSYLARPLKSSDGVIIGAAFTFTEPPSLESARLRFGFTPREVDIVGLLIVGKTNARIGEELFISLPTVKTHLLSIFRKTGVRNRTELVSLLGRDSVGPS
jgi:DNA-binding CsgD family transcriptional regulator